MAGTGIQASCMALVAGTAVGAGVLAMPAKTVRTGLLPSSVILALCWMVSAHSFMHTQR